MEYGGVRTAHKAQGSEWEHTVYVDEMNWRSTPHKDRPKHLYTGITRASKSLVLATQ